MVEFVLFFGLITLVAEIGSALLELPLWPRNFVVQKWP